MASDALQFAQGLIQLRQSLFEQEQHRRELKRQLSQQSELEQARLALAERSQQMRASLGQQHAGTQQFEAETQRIHAETEAKLQAQRVEDQRQGLALRIQANLAKGIPQAIPDSLRQLVKVDGTDYHSVPLEGGGGEYVVPLVTTGKDETGADIKKPAVTEQLRANLEKVQAQTAAEYANSALHKSQQDYEQARLIKLMSQGAGALQLNSGTLRAINEKYNDLQKARNLKIEELKGGLRPDKNEAAKYEADPLYGLSGQTRDEAEKIYALQSFSVNSLYGLMAPGTPGNPVDAFQKLQALQGIDLNTTIKPNPQGFVGNIKRKGLVVSREGQEPAFYPLSDAQLSQFKTLGPDEGFGYEETYYGPEGKRVGRAYTSLSGQTIGAPLGQTPYGPKPSGSPPPAPGPIPAPGAIPLGVPPASAPGGPTTAQPSTIPLSPQEAMKLVNYNQNSPKRGTPEWQEWQFLRAKAGAPPVQPLTPATP